MSDPFDVKGKVVAATGGGGILCSVMLNALAKRGAKTVVMDIAAPACERTVKEIQAGGGQALAVPCDVLDPKSMQGALDAIRKAYGTVDVLINGAGGNKPGAVTAPDRLFFDLPVADLRGVFDLNLLGTVIPSQVFGRYFADKKGGIILNISSMAAFSPLTKVMGYSAAKAAVSNFTEWLAVHMAQEYSPKIRVNALAPGFFITNQNRFLLTDEKTGALTARGQKVIDHTPMARFGEPEDLVGAMLWLVSDASAFVTGTVIPVDGGFNAYSGV